jgi:hypothetical protein
MESSMHAVQEGDLDPVWLDANFCPDKILANQYLSLPKLGHAKLLARNLGIQLV